MEGTQQQKKKGKNIDVPRTLYDVLLISASMQDKRVFFSFATPLVGLQHLDGNFPDDEVDSVIGKVKSVDIEKVEIFLPEFDDEESTLWIDKGNIIACHIFA